MGMTDRFLQILAPLSPLAPMFAERADPTITVGQYGAMLNPWDFTTLNYLGNVYPASGLQTSLPGSKQEEVEQTFEGYVRQAYRSNGIVFACMAAHLRLFTEARFQWQRLQNGRPGDLFGTAALQILEHPWPGGTTGDLLGRMIQDADLAGNAFVVRRGDRLKRMRPDWVSMILGSDNAPDTTSLDLDAELLGFIYWPGGKYSGNRPVPLAAGEVAHFAPIPDPFAVYRGMSWLTPIVREIMSDSAATSHKLTFFENGATPNLVIKRPDSPDKAAFELWKQMMEEGHAGIANAYRTLYMTAGADATVVGGNMQQLDFKVVQGAGETRIAAAAGVPPIIVGLSEGLASATYSNYGQARRAYADLWARSNWRNVAGSLETIIPPPAGARLWVDDRDIRFLAEDEKDAAQIQSVNATSIRALIDTGFKADAVVKAIEAGDIGLLIGQHTGLFSVQLQAPGSAKMPAGEVAGEQPVGEGTGPEKVPPGATKPTPVQTAQQKAAGGGFPPGRSERYSDSEARVPAGQPGGGQWTSGGAGAATAAAGHEPGWIDPMSPEVQAAAQQLYDTAAAAEPQITKDMLQLEAATGGQLVGFHQPVNSQGDFRLKTQSSIARKLGTDPDFVQANLSLADRVAKMKDTNRYTIQLDPTSYAAGIRTAEAAATKMGYDVQPKNVWKLAQSGYAGYHVSLYKEGQPVVELQFHTPASFQLKELGDKAKGIPPAHILYDQMRTAPTAVERAQIQRTIDTTWAPIREQIPPGTFDLPPPPAVLTP